MWRVVEQGLLPQIIFHGRRFKELFMEPISRSQPHNYLQIAHSFQSRAIQKFASDQLQTKFHQQVYKYMCVSALKSFLLLNLDGLKK